MTEVTEKTPANTSVTEFYYGKSILITGATGFLGAVLLETLLRCCPGIKNVYILLREKKGVSPKERKAELFKRSLFDELRTETPAVFDKVHVVAGDVTAPGMGMSEEDLCSITENVSIVFHGAESASFSKALKYLMLYNALATNNMIDLCAKLKHCEVLVYTSTAYSNCNRKCKIEERVYRLPYPTEHFINATFKGDDHMLHQLVSECKPEWPNAYTFSKCLAENLLVEKGFSVPIAIIRPSLIAHVWKGILPGYAEENSKFTEFLMGIAKGFIKVVKVNTGLDVDFVPVDVVANAHIVSGWAVATRRHSSPFVVNCSSHGSYSNKMRDIAHAITSVSLRNPPPNIFRYTDFCWMVNQKTTEKFLSIFVHYIPALALDLLLLVIRQKPRVVSLYRYLDRKMAASRFLFCNSWTYETENFKSLQLIGNAQDKESFYTELDKLDMDDFIRKLETGAPFYDWKTDKKPKFGRLKMARRTFYFTQSVQAIVALLICCLFYAVFCQVKNVFSNC